jgi:hypothetical protein
MKRLAPDFLVDKSGLSVKIYRQYFDPIFKIGVKYA